MIQVKHFMQLYFYYLQSRRGSAEIHLREVSMKGMKTDKILGVVGNFRNSALSLENETQLVCDEKDVEESE